MAFYHKLPPKKGGYSQEVVKVVKTRKAHPCHLCKDVIPKGNKAIRELTFPNIDDFGVEYTCETCVNNISNIKNKNTRYTNVMNVWEQYKS
jgi:hypothetical protein